MCMPSLGSVLSLWCWFWYFYSCYSWIRCCPTFIENLSHCGYQLLGLEDANECNPECDGIHLSIIPPNTRKLLPPGYSAHLGDKSDGFGGVSPRRAQLRRETAKGLQSQGKVMQWLTIIRMGDRMPIVGDMVQVKIHDVDRAKLDAPCLTALVVEVW